MVIPNSQLVDTRVVNRSYPEARMACSVKVQVPAGKDFDLVRSTLEGIPGEISEVLEEPAPQVTLQELSPESGEFLLSFWIRNSRRRREVVDQVYHRIWQKFRAEAIWPGK